MSHFNNKSITNKGLELLSATMAGSTLEFTRIVMGDGTYDGDLGMIESLVSQKQSLDIKSITRKGSQVILSSTLLQSAITEDFYWKEIGVYAKGVDDLEVLYMYGSATEASFISKDMLNEKMINVGVLVSNAQNITATIDGSLVYLSRADLEEHNNDETAHRTLRSWVQGLFDSLKLTWDSITGKPETFPPSTHTHDDRYYTEAEIDTKLNAKANSSHTHTKSQITDFPTSLPANGGDANTVGGVGVDAIAKYYRTNGSVDIADTNIKQFYGTCVTQNASAPSTDWWHIINVPHSDNNGYGAQIALGYHGNAGLHVRSASGTTWGNWYDVIGNIESLKSSVVSGKQEVVNAINDKLGYASGLTASHPFADLAWWIRNKITCGKTLINQMTFTCAARQNNSDTYNVTQEEIFSTGFEDSATNRRASGMYVIEFNMNAGSGSFGNPDFLSATVNGNTTFFNEDRKTIFVVFANANLCTDSRGAQLKNAIASTIKFSWRMGYSNTFTYAPVITVKYYHVDVSEFFK